MNISIFGLGYVGCVSGACLASLGHNVIGVDSNQSKVDMVNQGISPIVEQDIDNLIKSVVKRETFSATSDWASAVKQSDMALVCVGTPQRSNGSIDLSSVTRVSEHLAKALRARHGYFLVVIRSTVLPGTVDQTVIPILEQHSGRTVGKDFGVCMNPEFLREGSSIHDFFHPPKTVIGQYDHKSGDLLAELYKHIDSPVVRTQIKIAEMLKYTDNSFHALKVTFANEIGNICKRFNIDSHKVMDIFCMDTKLNLSPYYLKPGFAFGGSCLPKDLRAITYEARRLDLDTPVLNAILESNKKQILKAVDKLIQFKGHRLGFLGLSFKGGTDDLRESPLVELIETMIGKGFTVRIYDKNVSIAKLVGANKEYIENEIPHISSLMCSSPDELIQASDVIIVGNYAQEFIDALMTVNQEQSVVDLVRLVHTESQIRGEYHGFCW
jgi:GDP-mannose 6-dehydrogenase